jgi:sensor histidine kinase YesM
MSHPDEATLVPPPAAQRDVGLFRTAGAWPGGASPLSVRSVVLVAALWTTVGLFQAAPDALKGFQWPAFAGKLLEAWCWALLTPVILLIDRRLTSSQQSVVRLTLAHLLLSVPFSLAHTYLSAIVEYPIAEIWWSPIRDTQYAIYYFLGGWTTYAAFVGALQALKFYNRFMTSQVELERVEKRLLETRLNALRLQLEPQFLFNTLNAISSELAASPALAREMIEDLGALLRRSLECQDRTEITLAQEMELLDHYLAIQKLRFGNRIDIRINIDPAMLTVMVPSMLLQPLVENAIRHGIGKLARAGRLEIRAQRQENDLVLEVQDDGPGLTHSWDPERHAGIGLSNTRARLRQLYGERHSFEMISRDGLLVRIRLPLSFGPRNALE